MANTYTQLYVQCVFAPRYRAALLQPQWGERMRMYITGITHNNGHKVLAINNMPDHLHLFVGLNPNQSISELMRLIKGDSSEWINKEKLTPRKFHWQDGYGAFTYSKSQIGSVINYIDNQQEHHKKITFLNEYKQMLEKFEVEYDERYIFKLPEED
jgi:putative transposase